MTERPEWERVNGDTSRLRVEGGWLYRVQEWREEWVDDDNHRKGGYEATRLLGMGVAFVPDPKS